MADDLMLGDTLDYCLVVGAEEADWLLCDAYRKWRLLRSAPPIEPFQQQPRGMILSEGAGALLLASEGRASARPGRSEDRRSGNSVRIEKIAGGANFRKQREAAAAIDAVFSELCAAPPDFVAASANGTFIDQAEETAIGKHSPKARVYSIKAVLGESVGASSLWQTITAAQALITQRLPGFPEPLTLQSAVVSTCGLNQQAAGLRLELPRV